MECIVERQIFQASDLSKERTRVLDAARAGRALVRDKDGTGLVMLPEAHLSVLEGYAKWSQLHGRVTSWLEDERETPVAAMGELGWLRVFDRADQREFANELHAALVSGLADEDLSEVDEVVAAWRITGKQLEDPLRRAVLLSATSEADLVEASEPTE